MSIVKNKLKQNFTTIPNALVQDTKLSDRARFIYCYMSSMPETWKFYVKPMATSLGYSVETLSKYMTELIDSGWIKRDEDRIEGKFNSYAYTLNIKPSKENTDTEKNRDGKKPTRENLDIIKETLLEKKHLEEKHTLISEAEKSASHTEKKIDISEPLLFDAPKDNSQKPNSQNKKNVARNSEKKKNDYGLFMDCWREVEKGFKYNFDAVPGKEAANGTKIVKTIKGEIAKSEQPLELDASIKHFLTLAQNYFKAWQTGKNGTSHSNFTPSMCLKHYNQIISTNKREETQEDLYAKYQINVRR